MRALSVFFVVTLLASGTAGAQQEPQAFGDWRR